MVGESQEIKLINIQDGDDCDAGGAAGPGQVFLVLVLSNLGHDQSSNEAQLVKESSSPAGLLGQEKYYFRALK